MRRRDFIAVLGGAVVWPIAARAERTMPVVGFLSSRSSAESGSSVAAFRQGLAETGYVEGKNVVIEYRWAENRYDRLSALAADLIGRRVAVIVTVGGSVSAVALKETKTTIPHVFISGGDPVRLGLVASLNRPGASATGVNLLSNEIEGKRLGLLHELAPNAAALAYLTNPKNPEATGQLKDIQAAARDLGIEIRLVSADSEQGIDLAFATIGQLGGGVLLIGADPMFYSQRRQIVSLARRYAVPTIYKLRGYVADGGLVSYGPNLFEMYRSVGDYTGKIVNGAKPGDLPVIQSLKLELVINLKTAKDLGLEIPASLLARADEVIE